MRAPKRHAQVAALFLAGALLLGVIQPPVGLWPLAWVALVPIIVASTRPLRPWALAGWAALASLIYWLVSLHWLQPITTVGWIGFCLYLAPLWSLYALALQRVHWQRGPLPLCAALLWVGVEQAQGLFLGGFHWRYLAHSQFQNLGLIQIADVLGAAGVSFVLAWVNGVVALVVVVLWRRHWPRRRLIRLAWISVVLVAGTLAYGHWRLNQTADVTRPGPRVGAVQSNVPQHIKETFAASDQILDRLLAQSRECAAAGVDLIVWPETMVQGILDERVWAYLANTDYVAQCRAQDTRLRDHARNTAFLLTGTYGAAIRIDDANTVRLANFNSANLYRPDGTRAPQRYDKIHPILFGETLPFRSSWPALHRLILSLTPYDYDYSLDAGTELTRFTMTAPVRPERRDRDARTYRFAVVICYEDTLPELNRRLVYDPNGRKAADWLVNISNDGWFVGLDPDSQKVLPSAELQQHVAACVFRAVENRVSILRSVNTGISCLIDSSGALRSGFQQGSEGFPAAPLARQALAGWFVDTIPLDSRTTAYSRIGRVPDCLGLVTLGVLSLWSLITVGRTARRIRFSRGAS